MSSKCDALIKVNEFDSRSSKSHWLKITRAKLVDGMKKRLDDPSLINTAVVNLCGPGEFFRCLAQDDPVMYVQAIISLFETDSGMIGTRKFTSSDSLRKAELPKGMDLDWILLASLRDDENTFLNYNDPSGGLSGLTMPSGLANWFTRANYTGVTNETNVFFTKNLDDLKKASSLRDKGNRVCLLIDHDMLKVATQNNMSPYPDHWVVLMSKVAVNPSNNISFAVYSWGDDNTPVPQMETVSADTVCKNYLRLRFGHASPVNGSLNGRPSRFGWRGRAEVLRHHQKLGPLWGRGPFEDTFGSC
jgi:hypothetical protein